MRVFPCFVPIFLAVGVSSVSWSDSALTIYNQGFALVSHELTIPLSTRPTTFSFDGVTAQIESDSVLLRDPKGEVNIEIREQTYHNEPVSEALLLEQFVGQSLTFEVEAERGKIDYVSGKIIRSGFRRGQENQSPLVEIDGTLRFGLPGRPLFPSLGEDTVLTPTLSWELVGEQTTTLPAQLSYLSRGFSWEANYHLILPQTEGRAHLDGKVTIRNTSGSSFEEATIRLVAGEVRKETSRLQHDAFEEGMAFMNRAQHKAPEVSQTELDSYYLYELSRPLTLRDQEKKQVELLGSPTVEMVKSYRYDPLRSQRFTGHRNTRPGQQGEFPQDVQIYWGFHNTLENGLGRPLPAGPIRLYQKEEEGRLTFLGENQLAATPQKEHVEFHTGNAFDLIGERRVLHFEYLDREDWMKETIEITVRNRSKEAVVIEVREPLYRWSNWEIEEASHVYVKTSAQEIRFEVPLQPDQEEVISFRPVYRW